MAKKTKKQKPFLFIEILSIAILIFFLIAGIKIFRTPHAITQTYKGVFPCADCSGLDTTLRLTKETTYATYGTYTLEEVYKGKNLKPYIITGTWNIIHGTAKNAKTPVLELQTNKTMEPSYFQVINPTTLEMIDQEKKTIDSPFNLKLQLQQ